MKCMVCNVDMVNDTIAGIEIDVCVLCESVWLDGGEFEKLTGLDLSKFSQVTDRAESSTGNRQLFCANCGQAMVTERFEAVEIDRCPSCNSVWLDREELFMLGGDVLKLKAKDKIFEFITQMKGDDDDHADY